MIQHHNPNDWKGWDKSMSRYQEKLDKNTGAFGWIMLSILLVYIACWSFACHQMVEKQPPILPPDHSFIDSGWIEEHSGKVIESINNGQ